MARERDFEDGNSANTHIKLVESNAIESFTFTFYVMSRCIAITIVIFELTFSGLEIEIDGISSFQLCKVIYLFSSTKKTKRYLTEKEEARPEETTIYWNLHDCFFFIFQFLLYVMCSQQTLVDNLCKCFCVVIFFFSFCFKSSSS